jgi:phage replication O-like protein O
MQQAAEIIKFPSKESTTERVYVKADIDNGYYRVATELGQQLCKTQLSDRESRLINAVMLKTFGWHKVMDWVCYEQLAEMTNIDVSNIGKTKAALVKRNILIASGKKLGMNPVVSEWLNKSKPTQNKKSQNRLTKESKPTYEKVETDSKTGRNRLTQKKDTITRDTITKDTCKKSLKIAPEVIQDLFNQKLSVLGKALKLNPNRKTLIKARQIDLPTLQHWEDYFEKISRSNFLTGISSNWKASFDWILKDSNCLKILEGNYDNPEINLSAKPSARSSVSEHNQNAMNEWLASQQPTNAELTHEQ